MTQFSETPWNRMAAVAALAVLAAGCNKTAGTTDAPAGDKPSGPAIAVVDGHPITRAEYDFYVKQLTQGRAQELTPEQKTQVQDQLVSMQIMAAQGAKDHVESDPDTQAALEVTRMNLLAEGESKKYLKDHEPSDAELHAEYDSAIASLDKTEYHARHILVKDEALAVALTKKLKAGAKFEDLAKANSIDTGSKVNGGDLNWFTASRMVKPFSDALKTLKKGEITETPVQSQFGWHIIKLEDTRPLTPPPFEQVQDQIKKRLISKKVEGYYEELKKTAKIEKMAIDPVATPAASAAQPMASAPAASAATDQK